MPKKNKVFLEKIYPKAEYNLKKNMRELSTYIKKYIDKNNNVLTDYGPNNRLFFRDKDEAVVFKAIGIKPSEVKKAIKETGLTKSSWQVYNNPLYWSIVMCIRYNYLKRNKEELQLSLLYLSFTLYASIHYKYFKFEPNENIMKYTINNLSNKYIIKQEGSIYKMLDYAVNAILDSYEDLIKRGEDKDILDFVMHLYNRLNSYMKHIRNEFETNRQNKNYLNTESEELEDEDNYRELDNLSLIISRSTEKVTMSILREGVNRKRSNLASKMTKVSQSAIGEALYKILENENENIKEIVSLILQLYLVEGENDPDSIGTRKFLSYCLGIYSKSNTKDKRVLKIKEILEKWLNENSNKYTQTERVATKSNFRKAIFIYFVLSIQSNYTGR